MINPSLTSRILTYHDQVEGLTAKWWNPYNGDCFSIVEFLLYRFSKIEGSKIKWLCDL